jgi:hypothetical protein
MIYKPNLNITKDKLRIPYKIYLHTMFCMQIVVNFEYFSFEDKMFTFVNLLGHVYMVSYEFKDRCDTKRH